MNDTISTNAEIEIIVPIVVEGEIIDDEIPAGFVPKDFEMNPRTDDLVFGDQLKIGDIVIIGRPVLGRKDPESVLAKRNDPGAIMSDYDYNHLLEDSRWARVSQIRKQSGADYGTILNMIFEYADGTKRSHTYNSSYTWYVKK